MTAPTEDTPTPARSTTRDDLSLLYRVLRVVIRPLRPRLVKPGKPLPAGSPRLTDHPKSKNGCHIAERQDQASSLWLYDFIPSNNKNSNGAGSITTDTKRRRVLYFAGGGFQSPPASEHWAFVSKLASNQRLAATHSFTIVSYPLAPNSPACDSLPVLREFLKATCKDAARDGCEVTLMGDSAGGNVALSLGLWWVDQISELSGGFRGEAGDDGTTISGDDRVSTGTDIDKANNDKTFGNPDTTKQVVSTNRGSTLSSIVIISPAADLRNTNPAILEADKHDPVLSASLIEQTAAAWTLPSPKEHSREQQQQQQQQQQQPNLNQDAPSLESIEQSSKNTKTAKEKSQDRSNPYLSPVLATTETLRKFKKFNIKIHGVYGTHDVLAPDADLFRQKCVEDDHNNVGVGVPGRWLVWNGQMHCFVLAGVYGMPEGLEAIRWLVDVLVSDLDSD